jgi:hypothetical protein
MIVEALFVPNVLSQHIQRFMTGLIGHFEYARPILGGAGEKATSQGVSGISACIQPNLRRESLDDEGNTLITQGG